MNEWMNEWMNEKIYSLKLYNFYKREQFLCHGIKVKAWLLSLVLHVNVNDSALSK